MTEFQFLLEDRIQKIKSINDKYDLENKSYLSFSDGKDSTVLSALLDLALPENNIPRVYINTGKVMGELLPEERKQCETLWNAVYSEYRRIGYRLRTL